MNPRGPRQAFIESLNKKLLKEEVIIPVVLFIDNVVLTVNNEKVPDISLEDFIRRLHKSLVSIEPTKVLVSGFNELDNLVNNLSHLPQLPNRIISAFERIMTLPVNHLNLKLAIWSTNTPFINFYLDSLKKATTHLADLLIGRVTQNPVFPTPLPPMPQQPVTSAFPNSRPQLPGIQALLQPYPQTVQAPAPSSFYSSYQAPVQKATPSSAQLPAKPVNITELLALAPKPKPKPTPKKNKETIKDKYDKAMRDGITIFLPKFVSNSQQKKRTFEEDFDLQNNEVEEKRSLKKPRIADESENKPVAPSEKIEEFQDPFASFGNDLFADGLYDLSYNPDDGIFGGDEDSIYTRQVTSANNSPIYSFTDYYENENIINQTSFKPQNNR